MSGSHIPSASGPFSALTPSMWPQEILAKYTQKEEAVEQPDFCYDEFGFRVDKEDVLPRCSRIKDRATSDGADGTPRPGQLLEDPPQRLRWQAHLEFTHNHDVGDLTWDKIAISLPRSEKLRSLVLAGVPHSMRPQLWMRLSGALQKKRNSELSYREIVKDSANDETVAAKQIEKDLLRTMPSNACFAHVSSVGVPRLRRVLRALAWLYPEIGYCQGTGMVAACLLLFLEEEDAFWMMCAIIEDLLPASYFSTTLLGVQTDQRLLRHLIVQYLPRLDRLLQEHDIELSLITLHWFLTAFASVVHIRLLLRLWDLFFYEGSLVLFQTTLGMLRLKEEELIQSENSASIFNTLSDIPSQMEDADLLLGEAMRLAGSLTDVAVESQRRKHLAYLLADQGQLLGASPTASLSQVVRRRTQRRKSGITSLLFGEDDLEALKAKNIKQTELVADLREAILRVARHFQCTDPKNCSVQELSPDYSMESHQRDHENYVACSRGHPRRAKALLDFERHDDDELGFRKNDIITIVSQKDEHCWVGELNGLRGWFPAKFVEVLDERSKEYSIAGDDSVTEGVTDLVRGTLCPALKALFEHGLKKPSLLGGACHPWLFIEEAAGREVERDFDSVYSRLVLCKTYRLDEDGKVLTPEELLYRAVQSVNVTHDAAHAQMDVKLRSLICVGLNPQDPLPGAAPDPALPVASEQVLHLWLEVLCSSLPTVEKWYQPWSFLRSPGWVQIKCELRVLCCFAFSLSQDWELPAKREEEKQPLKEGVQDMLVKHHLFSWDIDG
ncbi:small G protein signaling modulator 3 isoform X3 [Physeter macrocephalus]|uniref:Small G protein signaling modulator 3 n=1 Tax=Physeter macrocephalus TaxID=9755 RepID=A0A455BBW3_PHYMC|nr:small G protein signaling modulator 3 isoform X3 [Physeter catodon]|eukprot:XP_028346465.1 small G protein signaling modulator 3 isoform X2 [Physeter catodon]